MRRPRINKNELRSITTPKYSRYIMPFCFSSRRRHTIFSRDWSSDVCSSDLTHLRSPRRWGSQSDRQPGKNHCDRCRTRRERSRRSEERRVGKECRQRRTRQQEKKDKNRRTKCDTDHKEERLITDDQTNSQQD